MNLKQMTFRSARWNVLRLVIVTLLQIIQLGVLARFLEPTHFGEIAVVMITLMFLEILSQTGVDLHVVRTGGSVSDLLDGAWSLQVVRGIALAGLLVALAGPIATYQQSDRLFGLLLLVALVPLLDGLRSVGPLLLARDLQQGRIVVAEVVVMGVSVLTSLGLAWALRSPWALALNTVSFSVLKTVSSYVVHPHRPRFTLAWGTLRPALRFGVHVNLAMTSAYVLISADKFILGRLYGHEQLGLYERAFLLANVAVYYLPRFLSATIYPSFSRLAETPDRFQHHTRRYLFLLVIGFTLFPIALAVAAGPVYDLAYGASLEDGLPLFRLLLFHASFSGIATGITTLFVLLGRAHLYLASNLIQLGALLIFFPMALARGSLEAVCVAMSAGALVGLLAVVAFAARGALDPQARASSREPAAAEPRDADASAAPRPSAAPSAPATVRG
ncbi:MAG: oligosaccharide flippase family protein [Planctomycetota bacterium]